MIDGLDDLVSDFNRAADLVDMRASVVLIAAANKAAQAARRSVPAHYGGTAPSITVGEEGRPPRPGETEVLVGADRFAPSGRMSAAAFLTFGTAKKAPTWDFFGQVEKPLRSIDVDLADIAGDL